MLKVNKIQEDKCCPNKKLKGQKAEWGIKIKIVKCEERE